MNWLQTSISFASPYSLSCHPFILCNLINMIIYVHVYNAEDFHKRNLLPPMSLYRSLFTGWTKLAITSSHGISPPLRTQSVTKFTTEIDKLFAF